VRVYNRNLMDHFPPAQVAAKIAVSLGIGLLVGIEREWSNKDLGARTFALIALLGTLAVLFAPTMAIMSSVGVFLIIIIANVRSLMVERSLAATTSAALLVIFVLGALVGQGHLFTPIAAAILMTMLLTVKGELHRFAGGLHPAEIRSAVLLGLLGFVVYPILPNHFVDKWQLINPRQAWLTVIVIAGIGFANYVLLKIYGTRGLYLSGFLGGFVNSSAAAVELAKPLAIANTSSAMAVAALLLTIIAMFFRNLILLALFAPSAAWSAVLPIFAMATVALIFAFHSKINEDGAHDIHLESPVSLKRVLSFALLFLAIQVLSSLAERHLGRFGFLAISALGGLVSSASTSAAAANMVRHGQLQPTLAGAGVVLASVTSALVNLPIIHRTAKNPGLSGRLSALTLLLTGLGTLVLLLQHYYMNTKR
jgi:uncharacterized membrane protein (DUF4010 family)